MPKGFQGFQKGHKGFLTLRDYQKIGKKLIGRISPKKGIKLSKKVKNKISKGMMGINTWSKGRKLSEEHKRKIIEKSKQMWQNLEIRSKIINALPRGEKCNLWIDGRTKERKQSLFYNRQRRNRELNAEGSHNGAEWMNLKIFCGFMCLCCKKCEPEIKLTEDHIIPLTKGGTDYIDNIQPLCQSCNSKKYNKIIKYEYINN